MTLSRRANEDEASGRGSEQGVRDQRHVNLRKTIHADRSRTGRRQINDPALDKGAPVIDPYHNVPPVTLVCYEHKRTKRQRLVGGREIVRVDLLAVRGQWTAAVGIGRPVHGRNPGLGMRRQRNTAKHKRGKNALVKQETPQLLLKGR